MTKQNDAILDAVLTDLQRLWVSSVEQELMEFELRRLEKVVRAFCRTEPVRAY